jgi:hypothetical protein
MLHFVFRTILAAMLSVPFIVVSYSEASAQQRATCSQARSHCGTQALVPLGHPQTLGEIVK